MAGPETIDITGGTFVGPAFDKRRKDQSEESRAQAASVRDEQARKDAHAKLLVELMQQGMELGPDGSPRPIHRAPIGDQTLTGEEYLKTVPADVAAKARMLIDGRMPWPNAGALRSPQMQAIISAAVQADPALDAANSNTRVATRKDFTSGVAARNLTALNTALGHLAHLREVGNALNNTWSPDWNAAVNSFQDKRLGDPRVNNFNTVRDAFATEVSKLLKGTGAPSMKEIEDWKARGNANMSQAQLDGFIKQGMEIILPRIQSLGDQYNRGMSKSSDPFSLLSPQAQKQFSMLNGEASPEEVKRADVFAGVPEGTHAVGEDVKGFRMGPEHEKAIMDYVRQPGATPEGLGQIMTAGAVAAGAVKPEQQAEYLKRATEQAKSYFGNLSPEQRANVSGGPDYSEVDKAATGEASLGESLGQAVKNAPQSAYEFGTGILKAPYNIGQLGIQAVSDPSGTAKDVGDVFSERYGGGDALKRTAVTDPVGLLGDASAVLTGGGSAARRLGAVGAGRALTTTGAALDPLAMAYRVASAAPKVWGKIPESVREGAGNVIPGLVGWQSGAGGQAVREAYSAGRSKPIGAPGTPQSEAFTSNLRHPGEAAQDTVDLARGAVGRLRQQASADYQRQIQSLGQNPQPLPVADLFQTLNDVKPEDYDVWVGYKDRPATHVAWERMKDAVVHYADQATQNPALLEPMAVDKFKQALYDIGSKATGAFDRDAGRIAGSVYQGTRKLLTDHDPAYAATMKNYGDAQDEIGQLEQSFGLAAGRGKQPNIDTASRRLQSIFRNNANTNYGRRAAQGDRLAELDPTGTLMPSLAGQQMSSWHPRSLRSSLGLAELGLAYLGGGLGPAALPAVGMSLPRAVGEASYGAGRLAGTGRALAAKAAPTAKALNDLYQQYPELALAGQRTSELQDQSERDKADALRRKYALLVPGAVDFDGGN